MEITMESHLNPQTKQNYITLHIADKKLVLRLEEGLEIRPASSTNTDDALMGSFGISRKK